MHSISGPTLEYLPEIFEKLFRRLNKLLIDENTSANEVREVIASIQTKTKLEPFFEIVELLSQGRISEGGAQHFRDEIAPLVKTTTNELLGGIKDLLISKQSASDNSHHSDANAESDTVKRVSVVFEQMLVVYEIPQKKAKQAIDNLESKVLNEILDKTKLVYSNLKAIRTHKQTELLIKFDITSKGRKTISNLIVEALKEGECWLRKEETQFQRQLQSSHFNFLLLFSRWLTSLTI